MLSGFLSLKKAMSPSSLAVMMGKMDSGLQISNGLNQREGKCCCMSDHISNHNFCESIVKRYLKPRENNLMKECINNYIFNSFKGRIILEHVERKYS